VTQSEDKRKRGFMGDNSGWKKEVDMTSHIRLYEKYMDNNITIIIEEKIEGKPGRGRLSHII